MDIIIGIALIVLALLAGHVLLASARSIDQTMKRWANYVSASALMIFTILFIAQRFLGLTSTVI